MRNDTRYFRQHLFNVAMMFECLRQMVLARGGHIVSGYAHPDDTYRAVHERDGLPDEEAMLHHSTYIGFTLHDRYYYYQVDDNPFFPHKFQIAQMSPDGKSYRETYLDDAPGTVWLDNCFFERTLSRQELDEAAGKLLAWLLKHQCSDIAAQVKMKRVPNIYNNGWHMERRSYVRKRPVYVIC